MPENIDFSVHPSNGDHLVKPDGFSRAHIMIAVLVTLLVTEILLRIFVLSPVATSLDPDLGWRLRPDATILNSNEGFARNQVNSIGYLDTEPSALHNKQIVVALGDSFTEALQVSHEDNFTSVAEKLSPCLDVINAGQSGRNAIHYPIMLNTLKKHYAIDHIVVVFSSGDIDELAHSNFHIKYTDASQATISSIIPNEIGLSPMRLWLSPILENSSLATFIMRRIKEMTWLRKKKNPKNGNTISQSLSNKRNAQRTNRILDFVLERLKHTAPTSVLYIPTLIYGVDGTSTETHSSVSSSSIFRAAAEATDTPFARVESFGSVYKTRGNPPVGFHNSNIRYGHLNASGHRATAKALVKLLGPICTLNQ